MWGLFLNLVIFFSGIAVGKMRATNFDISTQTAYMQDLIDQAYKERDDMKRKWIKAEEKAETWQRRYWATFEQEDEEDGS